MKVLFLILPLVFSIGTHAGVLLEARIDHDNASYTNSTTPSYSKFYLQTGRLDWKGKINEEVSYRFRMRFDKDQGSVSKRDGMVPLAVEYANIQHKVNENINLTLGKLNTDAGGMEQAWVSGSDTYFKSQAISELGSSTANSTTYAQYVAGFKLGYQFSEHELAVVYGNQPAIDSTSGSGFDQSKGIVGAIFKGSFLEKTLFPMISYYTYDPANPGQSWAATNAPSNTYVDVGIRYDVSDYYIWLDQNMYTYKNKGASGQSDTTSSTVAEFAYKMNEWLPKLKLESSATKVYSGSTSTDTTYTGVAAALEYKPTADNFRYHIAYTNRTTSVSGASTSPIETHFVLGMKIVADVLK